MLSAENDLPRPHLENTSVENERPSQNLPLPLPEVDQAIDSDTQLSKFSIRDYVFTARSKDTKNNWPFSIKSLQLSLDRGVKELLPPFEFSDALGNQSFTACSSKSGIEPCSSKSHSQVDPRDNIDLLSQQPEDRSTVLYQSERENEFPSATTSVSQSKIKLVETNKPSDSPLETDTLLEVEVEDSAPLQKSGNTSQLPPKKRKLIVKFDTHTERNSVEYFSSSSTSVSEMMTSKICPVCKTFSSSSNTTLNAHIDQCLTMEPTPNGTTGSKLARRNIKCRKIRHIEDIYATAKPCTLEELDKNYSKNCGTTHALPTEDDNRFDIAGEVKVPIDSPLDLEDNGNLGTIDIDEASTNGHIFSMSSDAQSVSEIEERPLLVKHIRRVQSSKTISKQNERHHALKHQKYRNLDTQSKADDSDKVDSSQICSADQWLLDESFDEIGNESRNQAKHSYLGALKQWVGSKRSIRTKKIKVKVQGQTFKENWFTTQELVVNNIVSVGSSLSQEVVRSSKNVITRNGSKEKTGTSLSADQENASFDQNLPLEIVTCPAIQSRINTKVEISLPPMKENSSLLSNGGTSLHVDPMPSNIGCGDTSSDKLIGFHAISANDSDNGYASFNQMKEIVTCPTIQSKNNENVKTSLPQMEEKSSLLSEDGLSIHVDHLPSTIGCGDASSEKFTGFHASSDNGYGTNKHLSGPSHESTVNAPRFPSLKRNLLSVGSRSTKTNSSKKSLHMRKLHDVLRDLHEKCGAIDSGKEIIQALEKDVSVRQNAEILTQSISPKLKIFGDRNARQPFGNADPFFCKIEGLTSPVHSRLTNDHDKICAYGVDDGLVRKSNSTVVHLGSELGVTFPEVDSLPTPGSFLPSPRIHENSLSTPDILSSPYQDNLNLEDSSRSQIYAITMSNFIASMPDRYSEPFSAGLLEVGNDIRIVASSATFENAIGNNVVVPRTSATMERTIAIQKKGGMVARIESKENLNGSKFICQEGSGSFIFESEDNQPCHCQKRLRLDPSDSNNLEEPRPLKRPTMASSASSKMRMQMVLEPKLKPWISERLSDENFSLSSKASIGSLDVSIPIINSLEGLITKGSPDFGPIALARDDNDRIIPSLTPTLRLMGKNLMVVNKLYEDLAVSPNLQTPNPFVGYSSPQVSSFVDTPCCYTHNQNMKIVQDTGNSMRPCSSMNSQSGMKPQQPFRMLTTEYLNQMKDVRQYMDQYFMTTRSKILNNSSNATERQNRNIVSTPTSMKDFIFIVDVPDNTKELVCSDIAYNHGDIREHHTFLNENSHSMGTNNDFSRATSLPEALSMGREANINIRRHCRRVGVVSARRSCTRDGMGKLERNHPFVADYNS